MKKLSSLSLLIAFSVVAFSGCQTLRPDAQMRSPSAKPQPSVDNSANTKTIADDDQNSPECVRAKPEPIINKEVFTRTSFKLEKNSEFPFEFRGYETIEFENGDKLLIKNLGCENFTLKFHFETDRFPNKTNDIRFWYQTAADLMTQTMKGIREPNYIIEQVQALNSYIEKNKRHKFNEEIEVGDGSKETVTLEKIKKINFRAAS